MGRSDDLVWFRLVSLVMVGGFGLGRGGFGCWGAGCWFRVFGQIFDGKFDRFFYFELIGHGFF